VPYCSWIRFEALWRGLRPTIALHWCNDCKQKDLALLRLRKDLGRYAPDMAARLREGVAGGKET